MPGLLTASAGLFALVYGFSNAETQSWTATATIIALVASPVLLITFAVIESRVKNPLLPLHIVRDRARGDAYLSVLLASAGVFGVFFFLTYYMQLTLHFSPLTAGLAFLPMTAVLVATSVTAQTRVLPRTGAKPLVMTGMTLGVIAMIIFTRLTPGGAYATHVLPGLLVIGVGMGCIFAPAIGTATLGVEVRETGVASAMVNTSQQVGGAVGLALLSTLSASAATDYARAHARLPGLAGAAAVHGYTTGFSVAAGIFATGLVLALLILPSKAGAHECTLRTALARGIAYAHHLDAAAVAATHSLRMSTRPPPPGSRPPDRDGSPDRRDAPAPTPRLRPRGYVRLPSGVLRRDQHRAFRVRGELVRDAAQDGAGERAPSALAADDQARVDLTSDLTDRLGHRLVRLRDTRSGVVAAPRGRPRRPPRRSAARRRSPPRRVGLRSARHQQRASSGQLDRDRRPHDQHDGIGGMHDELDGDRQGRLRSLRAVVAEQHRSIHRCPS